MHDREKVIFYISNTRYSFIFTGFSWSISPKVYFLWLLDSIYDQIIQRNSQTKRKMQKNEKWEWEPRKKLICIKENKFHLEGKLRGNLRDTKLMKYIMA